MADKNTDKPVVTEPLLARGPVNRTIIYLTAPMLIGHISMTIFNLTDTWYVSLLGTKPLAAMSFTFPIVMLVNSLLFGLGIGAGSVISRALGKGNYKQVKRVTTDCIILTFLLGLIIMLIGTRLNEHIFYMLGARDTVLKMVTSYMSLWFLAFPFSCIPMVANSAIRATGNVKAPSILMSTAAILNIVIDPVFIFGLGPIPAMGIRGAAIATIISRVISLVWALWIMHFNLKLIDCSIPSLKRIKQSWESILFIGMPASATNMLIPISNAILTKIISSFGPAAVAALGAGSRIDIFAMMIIMAMSSVLLPFTGQNYGAGKVYRIQKANIFTQKFSISWGAALFIIFLLASAPVSAIFTRDPQVIETLKLYLQIIPLSYGMLGITALVCNQLNGLHKPLISAMLNATRTIALIIPAAWGGAHFFNIRGIFIAISISNIIAGTICIITLAKTLRKLKAQTIN